MAKVKRTIYVIIDIDTDKKVMECLSIRFALRYMNKWSSHKRLKIVEVVK